MSHDVVRRPHPPVRRQTPVAAPPGPPPSADTEAEESDGLESPSRGRWWRKSPPWLVSALLHMLILLVLGILTIPQLVVQRQELVLGSLIEPREELDELEPIAIDQLQPLEVQQVANDPAAIPDPGQIQLGDITSPNKTPNAEVGQLALPNTTIGEIGDLFGKNGQGMVDISDGLQAAASFFGKRASGNRFVFVVDNSNSMQRGRFVTALEELIKSVSRMSPRQSFYVIFFSDTAYPMFHPEPAPGMVPATDDNLEKLRAWLYTVERCLHTRGKEAVSQALAMRPDAIYILGDGAFTDDTTRILTAPHNRNTVIHTFGMEVKDRGKEQLVAIAQANRGEFTDVRATSAAIAAERANPIKSNNTKGPVWGVTLPFVRKQKN